MMFDQFKRHLRIFRALMRMSWMESMEYRLNFVTRIAAEMLWYSAQIVVFEVLYYHTSSLAGWQIEHVRVFMGTLFMFDCLWMVFFNENFDRFAYMVQRGELDLLLTKPVDAQFMVTLRKSNPIYMINFLMTFSYFAWAVSHLPELPGAVAVMKYLMLLMCGMTVLYSLRMLFAILTIIVHNATSITYVWYQFYRLGTRPHSIYPSWLRVLLLSVFPVGLMVSVPSYHLMFKSDATLWTTPLVTVVLFVSVRKLWLRALRQYTSVSS